MSVLVPKQPPLQQFYRSGPLPCPYLPDRIERKLFTRLAGPFSTEVNATLTQAGFRRSHDILYRPVCPDCTACVPVRVVVAEFRPDRTMRKLTRLNSDLYVIEVAAVATPEQLALFQYYQSIRHADSDMARMESADFAAMIEDGQANTLVIELRRHGSDELVGAMLVDRVGQGHSAVYSFFNPLMTHRSLGTFLVLSLIDLCRQEGLLYLYLGYWIEGSRKMSYKARFQPLEALGAGGWRELAPHT
ncbi:Aspartate/glutamate leucyltransferase [uncultured Gammaproteobacteria bacterium]